MTGIRLDLLCRMLTLQWSPVIGEFLRSLAHDWPSLLEALPGRSG